MRAVILERFGGPDAVRLGDTPQPAPQAGEVEVQIAWASINPVDLKIRAKKMWPFIVYRPPLVLGNDCSGVVLRVGEGVSRFKPGDRVALRTDARALGAFADVICARESMIAHVPAKVSLREAAALPLVGLTAHQALFETAALKAGQRVFIQAGAGGFGTLAIQLAAGAGAHVATTASGIGVPLCTRLGAHEVVDYKKRPWQETLRDFDLVIDTLGGQASVESFQAVKKGGLVVSIGGVPTVDAAREHDVPRIWWPAFWLVSRAPRAAAKAAGATYRWLFVRPDGPQLEALLGKVERGELEVIIDQTFPFERALEALAYVETGRSKGKVLIELGGQ